jgi:hypothetical protein
MQEFIKSFKHDSDGGWTCISDVEFRAPQGLIEVAVGSKFTLGTKFFGVDLAEWLNEQHNNDRRKDGLRSDHSDEVGYLLRHFALTDQPEKSGNVPLL